MDMRAPHTYHSVIVVKKHKRWEVSTYGKIYAALVTIEAISLVVLSLMSLFYARAHSDEEQDAHSVEYTSIVAAIASMALLYFSLDSILLENVMQFYMGQMMHALITFYVVSHYIDQADLGRLYDRISLYVMIGVCTFQLAYLVLIYPVQETFGWRLYKRIGGNSTLRPMYRMASMFFSLLKLDFALHVLLVLLAIFYLITDPLQIAFNVLACVVTLGWLLLGYSLVRMERRGLALPFFLFSILAPSYLIYKLVVMKLDSKSDDDPDEFPVFSWNQLLLTGCVAVVVRGAVIACAVACIRNFGRGLKERMFDERPRATLPADAVSRDAHAAYTSAHSPPMPVMYPSPGQPVAVVVQHDSPVDQSKLRTYLQPLL